MQLKRLVARLAALAEELRSEGNEDLAARVDTAIEVMRCADPAYRIAKGKVPSTGIGQTRKPGT